MPRDTILSIRQLNILNQTGELTPSLDVLLIQVSSEWNPPAFLRIGLGKRYVQLFRKRFGNLTLRGASPIQRSCQKLMEE
jgi:hypothetical protein